MSHHFPVVYSWTGELIRFVGFPDSSLYLVLLRAATVPRPPDHLQYFGPPI